MYRRGADSLFSCVVSSPSQFLVHVVPEYESVFQALDYGSRTKQPILVISLPYLPLVLLLLHSENAQKVFQLRNLESIPLKEENLGAGPELEIHSSPPSLFPRKLYENSYSEIIIRVAYTLQLRDTYAGCGQDKATSHGDTESTPTLGLQ